MVCLLKTGDTCYHLHMNTYQSLIAVTRLDKPIGTLLLLWPTLVALWLAAKGIPPVSLLLIFVAGVAVMRAAGCIINDVFDRNFDGHVSRTQQRPIASGHLSVRTAMALFFVLIGLAFALALQLHTYTLLLSLGGAALAIIYPLMKRYTHFPQVVLGAAFGWSVPMAYGAVQGFVSTEAFLLFFSMLCWVVAYDTQYAMVDKADDVKIGIKSTAIAFGRFDKAIIAGLQIICLSGLTFLGWQHQLGPSYYLGLLGSLCCLIYQQRLIRHRQPANCFKAFLNNNYFGGSIFLGLFLTTLS